MGVPSGPEVACGTDQGKHLFRKLSLAAVILALGIVVSPAARANANIAPGVYRAYSTDLSDVKLTVSGDGRSVDVAISYRASRSLNDSPNCPGGYVFNAIPIVEGSASRFLPTIPTTTGAPSGALNISVEIEFLSSGLVTGSHSVEFDYVTASCPIRNMTFTAMFEEAPVSGPGAGATYRGTTSDGHPFEFAVSLDGTKPEGIRLSTGDSCTSVDTGTADIRRFTVGVAFFSTVTLDRGFAYFALYVDGVQAKGYLAALSTCGTPISATFAATAVAGTSPTPPPQVPGDGTISTGAIGRNDGFGLLVFTGGTNEQLVAASGCPASAARFWFLDVGDAWVTYVPGTTVFAVNAAWFARFPLGINKNTPLVGSCSV